MNLLIDKIVVVSTLEGGGPGALTSMDIDMAEVMIGERKPCPQSAAPCDGKITPKGKMPLWKFLSSTTRAHTLHDLYVVKDAISRAVEKKGYFLATTIIPPQTIADPRQPVKPPPAPAQPDLAETEPPIRLIPPTRGRGATVTIVNSALVKPVLIPPPGFGDRPQIIVNLDQIPPPRARARFVEETPPPALPQPLNTACIFIAKGTIAGFEKIKDPARRKAFLPFLVSADEMVESALIESFGAGRQSTQSVTTSEFENSILRINDWPGIATEIVLAPEKKAKADSRTLSAACDIARARFPSNAIALVPGSAARQVLVDAKVRVQPPGTPTTPEDGTVLDESHNLTAVTEWRAGRVSFGFDNRNNGYIGRWAAEGAVEINIPAVARTPLKGERLEARYKRSIDGARLASWDVVGDVWVHDTKASVSHGHSHSRPAAALQPLELDSVTDTTALYLSRAFTRGREKNVTVRLGGEAIDTQTTVVGNKLVEDRLRVARAGVTVDKVLEVPAAAAMLDFEVSQGFETLHATRNNDLYLSRENGRNDFTKLRTSASGVFRMPYDLSAHVSGSGQWARTPLLVSEQFAVGGKDFGRAFDPAAYTGDHGMAGLAELRWSTTADFLQNFILTEVQVQPYAFVDGARLWQKSGDTGIPNVTVASAGLGLRSNVALRKGVPGLDRLGLTLDAQGSAPTVNNGPSARFGPNFYFLSSLRGEF